MGRLLIAALWLGVGGTGVYTFFKRRDYIAALSADPDNELLKRQFKRTFYKSLVFLALGIWWAFSYWFPQYDIPWFKK